MELHFTSLPLALTCAEGERLLAQEAGGVGWQAGCAGNRGVEERVRNSSLGCRVGREGQKRGDSCARVFSGKVPLPLGMGKSLADLKTKNKYSQLLPLGFL